MKRHFMKKIAAAFAGVMMLSITAIPVMMPQSQIAEARTDYYVGYDDDHGDVYLDVDSVRPLRPWGNRRNSTGNIYFADGTAWRGYYASYDTSTGTYYYSGGAGGVHEATGWRYNFAVYCDRIAYE